MAVPPPRTRAPHVRRAAGYAAAARVFAVPELLENILDYLPMKDLFFAQDTCKHWKRVIAASTLLKRTLYLAPKQPTSFWSRKKVLDSGSDEDNPFFLEKMTKNAPGSEFDTGIDGKLYTGATFNPLLLTSANTFLDLLETWHCPCSACVSRRDQEPHVVFALCDRRIKGLESARNMLLTQPPCYQLNLATEDPATMEVDEKTSVVVCNTGGIKVGDFLSAIRRLMRNNSSALVMGFGNEMYFPTMEEEDLGVVQS